MGNKFLVKTHAAVAGVSGGGKKKKKKSKGGRGVGATEGTKNQFL